MATQTVILDPALIHSLSLTPESIERVGLTPGSPVSVLLQPGRITLQTTHPDCLDQPQAIRIARDEAIKLIDELRGCCVGGPSMTDELIEERRREDAHQAKKFGW